MGLEPFFDYIIYFLIILVFIFFLEIAFLLAYKIKNGVSYKFIKKIPLKKFFIIPHPYLPYIYKKGVRTTQEKANYPNNKNYLFPALKTNNFQFLNCEHGDRDIITPKPKNLIRINCLGASTTAHYVRENDKNFSYPLELERILKTRYQNKNLEVNNCAQGGYNSADILVRSALRIIDTEPDYVIIYHAYNDIKSYLTEDFVSDYSHSRKNLADSYWKFYLSNFLPEIPLNFYNYLKNKFLPGSNIRHSLLNVIGKGKFNINTDYSKGLNTYERNMKSIISLYKSINTKIILCTYSLYLYDEIKNNKLHKLYDEIVKKENEIIRGLAKKLQTEIVDADLLIEKNKENFVDSVHYSKHGMSLLAKEISKKINL